MNNVVLSTRNIEDFIADIANEVVRRLDLRNGESASGNPGLYESKDKILDVREAAEVLHLTVTTIYAKVSKGEIPHSKRGKRLYFSLDELIEYVKGGSVNNTADPVQYLKKRN
jgi:excisionase family DNA binding protein